MALLQPAPKHWIIQVLKEPLVMAVLCLFALTGATQAARYISAQTPSAVIVQNAEMLAGTCPVNGEPVALEGTKPFELKVTPQMRGSLGRIVPVKVPNCEQHLATREGREKALAWYKATGAQTGGGPGQTERDEWNLQLKKLRLTE